MGTVNGMKSLEEIATYYGTAKVPHGYMRIYEMFLQVWRTEHFRLLEIGVATGASMKTWRKYFKSAMINGVDKHLQYQSNDCILVEGDIVNPETQYKLRGKYSVIIDDGSHIASEQLEAFKGLWEMVEPNGLYFVEDLFTLYDPVWNPKKENIITFINSKMKNILTGGDSIQEVHYFGRNNINGILVLRKRGEEFRIQPLSEFKMIER